MGLNIKYSNYMISQLLIFIKRKEMVINYIQLLITYIRYNKVLCVYLYLRKGKFRCFIIFKMLAYRKRILL